MNERIEQLIEQTYQWCDENIPEEFSPETGDYGSRWKNKFAELIIKECAELNFRELGLSGSASFDVGRMIKQHFGVEE